MWSKQNVGLFNFCLKKYIEEICVFYPRFRALFTQVRKNLSSVMAENSCQEHSPCRARFRMPLVHVGVCVCIVIVYFVRM
jgi:hypothetical protein